MTISTEVETVFSPETTQNVCPCGVKHDEFVLPAMRVQFCPAENMLYVLEYFENFTPCPNPDANHADEDKTDA